MKLANKASYEMAEEIALTDSELEIVLGGQGWDCSPQPPCGGGAPSYSGSPYYNGSPNSNYSPYGNSSYSPNYSGSNYGSPFNTGSSCGGSMPSYTTITYTMVVPSNSNGSSPCNGGY